jgi:type IV fimbrial biogenesis protein FimT
MQAGIVRFERQRVRGVTLVELIVVIFLISMLLLATVPSVADWIRNVRVRATAESIASGLNRARTEAIKQNKVVTFWLVNSPGVVGVLDGSCVRSSTSASWVVSLDDPTGACGAAPSTTDSPRLISSKAAGESGDGVVIAAVDVSGSTADSISFNGFGQPVTGAGGAPIATLDITSSSSGARRLRIAVSTGGDMRLCDRDVSSSDPRRCL